MLNFVLCDDNLSTLNRLTKMLDSVLIKNNFDANISFSTTNPQDLLDYVQTHTTNVIILDIDLKSNITGLELANQIRKTDKNVYIIFYTAHLEFGLVAYRYKTFDYLPKPLTTERLEETILRLFDDIKCDNNPRYIRLDNNKTIIKEDSIQYIKKDGMKVVFHTDSRDYETYSSFNKIYDALPNHFVRCHKSYIVNIDKISNVQTGDNTIYFNNGTNSKCYIGPKYKNNFMEVFNNGIFSNNLDSVNNAK